ncbi:MAG TPA: proteasome accessory factor PafA2 family protein [Ktedonobacteraceae bacterium]|jgi:hypothetical protein|nr:proteasome accessory factor PafA2 family protein [Ktedonobacteraceae bacterium]
MSIPKMAGLETEYGILMRGMVPSDPFIASQFLMAGYRSAGGLAVSCQSSSFSPVEDERDHILQRIFGTGHVPTFFDHFSLMLPNGARFYIDHAHPEYSTPESCSARTLLAADKAGEMILNRSCQWVNANGNLSPGQEILLYKNNSDHHSNSYGCHENYLLSASFYEDMLYQHSQRMLETLLPFLVTRTIICGAGKVGAEHGREPAAFQLSQRADFFERVMALETTVRRPLFNTRDEPHNDPTSYRRLHVIIGDANMAEYSGFLKIGMTQLVLRLLEDGFMTTSFQLADPVAAMRTVSRDLSFRMPLLLKSGKRATALEIQKAYLELAQQYLQQNEHSAEEDEVIALWQEMLAMLEQTPRKLAKSLDWAIKKQLLEYYLADQKTSWKTTLRWQPVIEQTLDVPPEEDPLSFLEAHDARRATSVKAYIEQHTLSWEHYQQQRTVYFGLRRIDLDYHALGERIDDEPQGLYYRLLRSGGIQRLLTNEEIATRIRQPPSDTRAWLRGQWIQRFAPFLVSADWDYLHFQIGPEHFYHDLPTPFDGSEQSYHDQYQHITDIVALRNFLFLKKS